MPTNVTIPAGRAIALVVSNGVAGVDLHVNYDSTNAPSVIVLPATTAVQIESFGIYDAPYPGGKLVSSPLAGSTLYIRAYVSDPFGSYDITGLDLTVLGLSPGASFTNSLTGSYIVATTSSSVTYEYPWATGPTVGSYDIIASAYQGTDGVSATAAARVTTTYLDFGTPSTTVFTTGYNSSPTSSYFAGSPVCIQVTDFNRNTNAAVIDSITVTVTSSAGDSELLTLQETGTNTGVFANCVNVSTNVPGATNDATLFGPAGSILTASYSDPTDPTDSTSAVATVQPAPGVPGLVVNLSILSPSGGHAGVGQPVTLNLQIVNIGSLTLPSLSLSNIFTAAILGYSTASLAPQTLADGFLSWTNLGTLAPGQSTNITVTFTTLATGLATNIATADGVLAQRSSTTTLQISQAALSVTQVLLAPTNSPVAVGSNVVFRIVVQNVGNSIINNLPMEDTFSGAYYRFVSSTLTNNGAGAGSLLWTNLADPLALAPNATLTNDVTMQVVGQGNPANNTATVDYATDIYGNAVPPSSSTFGVTTATAAINGYVYSDVNHNGVYTNGDTGLSGVTIQLYTDPTGTATPDTLVQITTTDASGYYELLNLNLGRFVVMATTLPGYVSSAPPNNRFALNLNSLSTSTNNNFFQYLPAPALYATVSGNVWYDFNGNGSHDLGETNLANVTVSLVPDVNTNGIADPSEPVVATVATDGQGAYSFAGVTPGNYVIRQSVPYGYYSTGDSQGRADSQISFVNTNGIVSTNNNFCLRRLPVAVADTGATIYFVATTLYPLNNDVSPNGDALTIISATSSQGPVMINPDHLTLTFARTNLGPIAMSYTIADAHGGSARADLTANGAIPFDFTGIISTNGGIELFWLAPPNDVFQVQHTDTLLPVNWQTFTNIFIYTGPPTDTNGWFNCFDNGSQTPPGLPPARFYRIVLF